MKPKKLTRKELISLSVIAVIVLCFAIGMQQYVTKWSKFPVTFETEQAKETPTFYLDIASTPPERSKGLMFVNKLAENRGMIFVFPNMKVQSFWMKNVPIPLDMIFIDDKYKVVGVVHSAAPMTEKSRTVNRSSMYVVELKGGTAKKYGIKRGSKLKIRDPFARGIPDIYQEEEIE